VRFGFLTQLVRYGVVVGSGFAIAIVLYSRALGMGAPAYPTLGVTFVLNGLYNFALFRAWVFPASGRSLGSDLARFSGVAAMSLVVNYSSFALLYSAAGVSPELAQKVAVVIAAPVGFFANRLWSFRRARSAGDAVQAALVGAQRVEAQSQAQTR
jgi:putative flippase GtrA